MSAPKCSQCDRPALEAHKTASNVVIWLCLSCLDRYQAIGLARREEQERAHDFYRDDIDASVGLGRRSGPRFRDQAPRRVSSPSTSNVTHITVQGHNLGAINAGTVQSLRNHVQSYHQAGSDDVAGTLVKLVNAIASDKSLSPEERQEALELVDGLAAERSRPAAERRVGVMRHLGAGLDAVLSRAPQLAALWPVIKDVLTALS